MVPSLSNRLPVVILTLVLVAVGCKRQRIDQRTLNQQLITAVADRNLSQVRMLLKQGADAVATDRGGQKLIVSAAMEGDAALVSALLENGISVKDLDEALLWAAMNEPLAIVEYPTPLPGAQPVAKPIDPINPIDAQYAEVAKLLVDKGAEIDGEDEEGSTPLIRAAGHGETAVATLLLDRGARLEKRNQYGQTALNAAACMCPTIDMPETLEVLKLLLRRGADIESKDNDGNTPLIQAAGWGRTDNVNFLVQQGAHIEARNNDGDTALAVAAKGQAYPTIESVNYLLTHKSNIESRNVEGRTPLMLAVIGDGYEQIKIVSLLLKHGANVHAHDKHGDTAITLAEKNHNPEIYSGTHARVRRLLKDAPPKPH